MNDLQILWAVRSYFIPDAGVKEHTHPFFHMFYVPEGSCDFTADGTVYRLSAGEGILVPKGVAHAFVTTDAEAAIYYEIKFAQKTPRFPESVLTFRNDGVIQTLLEHILNEYTAPNAASDQVTAAYLQSVLYLITEPVRRTEDGDSRYIDVRHATALSRKVVQYLENNYGKQISMDDLSASLGYNKSYLCDAFKKDMGTTILDCLNTIRIRRAAELLTYSEETLAHVSEVCGFSSVSHFTRVFQKYAGITPGQIRRAYPADALIRGDLRAEVLASKTDRIMYSVLARKDISFSQVRRLDQWEAENQNTLDAPVQGRQQPDT